MEKGTSFQVANSVWKDNVGGLALLDSRFAMKLLQSKLCGPGERLDGRSGQRTENREQRPQKQPHRCRQLILAKKQSKQRKESHQQVVSDTWMPICKTTSGSYTFHKSKLHTDAILNIKCEAVTFQEDEGETINDPLLLMMVAKHI